MDGGRSMRAVKGRLATPRPRETNRYESREAGSLRKDSLASYDKQGYPHDQWQQQEGGHHELFATNHQSRDSTR